MIRNVLIWLEQSAHRDPQHIAFEDDTSALTYALLLQRAQEIGSFLCGQIPPQSPVLIFMDKTPDCIAAMFAVVYAGCFYTPIDPAMPVSRMEQIVSVLQPTCILCERCYLEKAENLGSQLKVVCVEDIRNDIDQLGLAAVRAQHIDTDLLYVLFTSGSTGTPKGVAINHRSVIDFAQWACDALCIEADCIFGNQAPLYFDNSVLDIYCALRMGATVHFIPRKFFTFPGKMTEYLDEKAINTLFWVPSALTSVANVGALEKCIPSRLERIFFCGETMPCKTLNAWRKALPKARYVNMYGPTEITDVCTYFPVERDFADTDTLPIGFPCGNTRILLIDGEICVVGTCLSPGYFNSPDKTAEVFVPNPLRSGVTEMMYKTGDLGEYNERGELMFLGRKDSQIKKQGYRIELGEIECALCAHPQVNVGCCLYNEQTEQIIAVYSGEMEEKPLLRSLKEKLPKYMLPNVFVRRAQLPQTGNGKIDRVQLKKEIIG
ncbi:MAG: amino acid adenylation domain-containing protein [Christensenellales bacterium]|jgi:D-alanine--poly(phosphoribitol) ligase subunit 1|nr:amino acid adenylation domain-containing protein [Clostridiales bacterium]